MRILIDKAPKHFYMLKESLLVCKHGNILLSLTLKKNKISNFFAIYILYKYLPTKEQTLTIKKKDGKKNVLFSYRRHKLFLMQDEWKLWNLYFDNCYAIAGSIENITITWTTGSSRLHLLLHIVCFFFICNILHYGP